MQNNKASLLTPAPPPVPASMTATTSTPCSTLAPGQAYEDSTLHKTKGLTSVIRRLWQDL